MTTPLIIFTIFLVAIAFLFLTIFLQDLVFGVASAVTFIIAGAFLLTSNIAYLPTSLNNGLSILALMLGIYLPYEMYK